MSMFGVFQSSSDDSSDSDREERKKRKARKDRKSQPAHVKSGKLLKVSFKVLQQEHWPHSFVNQTQFSKKATKYDDLSMEQFVAGFMAILAIPDLEETERKARIDHLGHLMYLAMIYSWEAVLNFHAVCLVQVERRLKNWGDEFSSLESITLSGSLKGKQDGKTTPQTSASRSAPPLYCAAYQTGACNHSGTHMGMFSGKQRLLHHICANCLKDKKKSEEHPENECSSR